MSMHADSICFCAGGSLLSAAMQRPSLFLMLVVLLLGLLFLREPRLQQNEDGFLRWLLLNSSPSGPLAPMTVVEIGNDPLLAPDTGKVLPANTRRVVASTVSPLEFALFLQAALEFKPSVIAFENVLKWRERDNNQEQVFIDQAMRVPRLLLGAELTATPEPDAPGPEIAGFTHVTGKRGELMEFSGVSRQPGEDARLISTAGFVNLPEEIASDIRVPLLFRYRGEVIPSFALEAVLLWLRLTPGEVKIDLGSYITLPEGRRIPIAADGTMVVAPNAAKKARRMSLNDLLLAAQQRDTGRETAAQLDTLRDQIVLARTPANPLSPPDIFAATIATLQNNRYVHRVSMVFDVIVLVLASALFATAQRIARADLILIGNAFSAGYCLIALGVVGRWNVWLPGCLPIGVVWLLIAASIFSRARGARTGTQLVPLPIA